MPKTKEEILADIAKAVEGQGNQGAIAIAPILKEIVELAGEGGGGGLPFKVFTISATASQGNATVTTPQSELKQIYDYVAGGNTAAAYIELGGELEEMASAPTISRLTPTGGGITAAILVTVAGNDFVMTFMLQILINSEGEPTATLSVHQYSQN